MLSTVSTTARHFFFFTAYSSAVDQLVKVFIKPRVLFLQENIHCLQYLRLTQHKANLLSLVWNSMALGILASHRTVARLRWQGRWHILMMRSVTHQYWNMMGNVQDQFQRHLRHNILKVTWVSVSRVTVSHVAIVLTFQLGHSSARGKCKGDCTLLHLH